MTINTLIKKLEDIRDLYGGDAEMYLENFRTTTTTATEDLLKKPLVVEKSDKIKIILSDDVLGEIKLTTIKHLA